MANEELERFKRLPLHEYAAHRGYQLDKAESSRRELVMRHGEDKISVRMEPDGHYVYYSFRNPADNGTILDFVMGRQGKNLGEARKVLRLWAGSDRIPLYEPLEPSFKFDRSHVLASYRAMKDLCWHDWLENERCIPRPVLLSERFKGRIRVDARANIIFPHEDESGVCGFEIRNRAYKGFADLGKKALWMSTKLDGDARLVIGESAIDCLSHAYLFPDAQARYASFAGGISEEQEVLVAGACQEFSQGEIVCITHPDSDGERYADIIREAVASLPFRIHRPENVKDWNDVLKSRKVSDPGLHSFPAARNDFD